jgi:hypothetical protein
MAILATIACKSDHHRHGIHLAWFLAILLLILSRMIDINSFVDSDEAFSILLARHDFLDFTKEALQDRPHPPLHVLLLFIIAHLHLDIALFGRIFGILGSFIGIYLLTRMAFRETRSNAIAITILLVFALSNFFIYRSTVIRPYSIIIPLGCTQLYSFISMMRNAITSGKKISFGSSALRWWVAASMLLMWTQYLSLPITGVQFLILAMLLDRPALIRIMAILATTALGIAGWFYLGSLGVPNLTETWWVTEKPRAIDVGYAMLFFFGVAPISGIWLATLFSLVYANAVFKWRGITRIELALAAVTFVPIAAVFVLSEFGSLNIFAQRHFIVPALAFVVLTCSLTRLLQRWLQLASLFLIVAWSASSLPMGLPRFSKPPLEDIASSFAARGVKRIYTTSWEFHGLLYYAANRFDVRQLPAGLPMPTAEIAPGAGFVCRPDKCRAMADAMRLSGASMCTQRIKWNMVNYVYSQELWVFFPAASLQPKEQCEKWMASA